MSSQPQENHNPTLPPLKDYKDLLNAKNLAEIFGVTKQSIYKELKSKKFGKPIKIGRTYKVPKIYILQKYFSA